MYYCSRCDCQLEYRGTQAGYALYVCPRCHCRKEVLVQ